MKHGKSAEYFMFFKWKSKILVCLCNFYENVWVKLTALFFFFNHFDLGWKENSLKIDRDPVELSGKTDDFNETASVPKLFSFE